MQPRTWSDLLDQMSRATSWDNHDPMRVVDGGLDNAFSQSATPPAVRALPPVD